MADIHDEELKAIQSQGGDVEPQENKDIDSMFIGLDNDNGVLPLDQLNAVAQGKASQEPPVKFKPKVPVDYSPGTKEVVEHTKEVLDKKYYDDRIKAMEEAIKVLQAGRDGALLKKAQAPAKPIDWTKMTEASVFDFDINIPIEHQELPDYMKMTLKDANFAPRWVNKINRRLGPMKALGFTPVTRDEVEGELNIAIEPNENGWLTFDDVILMKIRKSILYSVLRKNHARAVAQVDPRKAHQIAKDRVQDELKTARAGDPVDGRPDLTNPGDFDKYAGRNKLEVYAPGMEI